MVDDIGRDTRRVEQTDRDVTATAAVPQDSPEQNHPGTADDQQQLSAVAGVPHEPAADRAAELQLIARTQFPGQVGETSPSSSRSTVIATGWPPALVME